MSFLTYRAFLPLAIDNAVRKIASSLKPGKFIVWEGKKNIDERAVQNLMMHGHDIRRGMGRRKGWRGKGEEGELEIFRIQHEEWGK